MVSPGPGEWVVLGSAALYLLFKFFTLPYIIGLCCVVGIGVYIHFDRKHQHWKKLGIPGPKTPWLVGNLFEINKKGIPMHDWEHTMKYGKLWGTYTLGMPSLLTTDLELIKQVTVKDFSNFVDRGKQKMTAKEKERFEKDEITIFSRMLTVLQGQRWKNVRNTVTPTFTAGKMKQMVYMIHDSLIVFEELLGEKAKSGEEFDVKQIFSNYAMDVIGKAAFAMDFDCQRKPDNPFMKFSQEVTGVRVSDPRIIVLLLFPFTFDWISRTFKVRLIFNKGEEFFRTSLTAVIEERKKNPRVGRPDFLQLLLNAQSDPSEDGGEVKPEDKEITHQNLGGKKVQLSNVDIIAQSFLFLFAGFETTATTMHWMALLLALHPEIQQRLLDEIHQVVGHEEDVTYDHIQKMPYLDSVVSETLRLYPPATRIDRTADHDYNFNGLHLPAYTIVGVPVYVIQHMEEYYPDPEKFDPERFSPEERANRNPYTYMPFGMGPRNCIGMRFAQMEMKMTMAHILRKFKFIRSETTPTLPVEFDPAGLLRPKKPIMLKVEKR